MDQKERRKLLGLLLINIGVLYIFSLYLNLVEIHRVKLATTKL